ncbi:MAG: Rid family hydrolase [Candidatus Micrarchaeaceae archaeon]
MSKRYSYIAKVYGASLILIAGQVAFDENGNVVGKGSYSLQAKQMFMKIETLLESERTIFKDVIELDIYILDISYLPKVKEVRGEFMSQEHLPTSTAVQTYGLISPDFLLGIDIISSTE